MVLLFEENKYTVWFNNGNILKWQLTALNNKVVKEDNTNSVKIFKNTPEIEAFIKISR